LIRASSTTKTPPCVIFVDCGGISRRFQQPQRQLRHAAALPPL